MTELKPDGYIEMKCGIKIPFIIIIDEDLELKVAPSKALPLIQNGLGELEGEEAEEIDDEVFFWADTFERSEEMLKEIEASTEIKGLKFEEEE
jgi:hypothetical protein